MSDRSTPKKPRILASELDSQEYLEGELVSGESATGAPTDETPADALDTPAGATRTEPDAQPDNRSEPGQQAVLALGGSADAGGIEITGLQENQISVLQEQHAKGLIEVQRKASELKVDIQALDQTLESLTGQARTANDAGVNITATHTQNTSLGQTEIIVGNTQRAAAGKVTPLWAGLENSQVRTGLMIAGAVLAGILLSALFG